jgi:hypothetical protein
MTRLSSGSTWFTKRMFPILWFGVIAFFLVYSLSGTLPRGGMRALLVLGPILIAAAGFLAMKRLIFSLADEVWDAGSDLVVRNQGREARIPLADIASVNYTVTTRPQRVTLRLRQSSAFGREITFAAPTTWIPFAKNPLIEDLIARVEDAGLRPR